MSADAQLPPSELAPLQRHPQFFDDGVIFLIERQFYRIPRNLLLQSEFFRDMFETPSGSEDVEGNSEEKPIRPDGVTTLEIESLLSLLNTSIVAAPPELNLEQLGAILHLSTKWGFERARSYAVAQIESSNISTLDRIEIAFKCIVPKWLLPAYKDLCTRSDHLSLDEAQRLGLVRYHIISKIREDLKPGKVGSMEVAGTLCSHCSHGSVVCNWCGRPGSSWRCPIEVDSELQKHKTELGLADD